MLACVHVLVCENVEVPSSLTNTSTILFWYYPRKLNKLWVRGIFVLLFTALQVLMVLKITLTEPSQTGNKEMHTNLG